MKDRTTKVLELVAKIIDKKVPRYSNNIDLLKICLAEIRAYATIAMINDEVLLGNELVDEVEKLEKVAYDWDLAQMHKNFYEMQYVPICVCKDIKLAEMGAEVSCEACEIRTAS